MHPGENRRDLYRSLLMGLAAGLVLGMAFVGGYLYRDQTVPASPRTAIDAPSEASFELLAEADGLLGSYFLGDLPDEETRVDGAVHGMVAAFDDPYTFYVEPQRHEIESANLAGAFGGIGAEIGRDAEGRFLLTTVYRDGPGYGAGLRDGDVLLEVDGVPVDQTAPDTDQVVADIRGPVGESVLLAVQRGDETLEFDVVREEVVIPSVVWRLLDEDQRIGYVRISRFTANAPDELSVALDELKDGGATAFIVDLRGNGGGLVDASVKVASEFLSGGIVATEERRNGGPRTFPAALGGGALNQPLVVLVDGATASASEIVAGALQDRERATLVGQQTFGKGSVQVIQEMSNGSSLHITSARWFTPDERPIDGQGLSPDIVVEPVEGQDAILSAAIAHLENTLDVAETASASEGN